MVRKKLHEIRKSVIGYNIHIEVNKLLLALDRFLKSTFRLLM